MEIKLYAPCPTEGCSHQFVSHGRPTGAAPAGKKVPVELLTCPVCGKTYEIPVKAFKAPGAEEPKQIKPEATSTGSGDDTGAGGSGNANDQQ